MQRSKEGRREGWKFNKRQKLVKNSSERTVGSGTA
jgi:hypothetical protein